jgi:sirohydrochlorin cobaltochelatase
VGVVLVGHGQLPRDLPKKLSSEYLALKFKHGLSAEEERRLDELEKLILGWHRDERNDPYYHSVQRLAEEVSRLGAFARVWTAFNEFCRPTLAEALEEACSCSVDVVVVVPTMMTRGGEHSEGEIPAVIEEFRGRCGKPLIYAWPFETESIAKLLVETVRSHLARHIHEKGCG